MGKTGIERRVHPRLALSLPVSVSSIDPETDVATRRPFFRASREWCANLSRGGVFVRTSEPFVEGRRVLVEITLPDGGAFESVGRVAWTQRTLGPVERADADGIGIEFLGSAPDHVAALERHLRGAGSTPEHAYRYVV